MSEILNLSVRLKAAVSSEPVPPYLQARISARIRSGGSPGRKFWLLAPLAVAAGLCVTAGIAYQYGHLRLTVPAQESYISSVSGQVATLMRVGLGDHIHCAVFRKYPKNPPTTEQFVEKLGPQFAGLLPIVRERIPPDYRMTLAHLCTYHGRKFVHLSLMSGTNLVSLAITQKREGESFSAQGLVPAFADSGIPMYQTGVQRFQISAFETRDHLIYFISDLPKEKNTEMMIALAGPVQVYIARQEL